MAVLYVRIFLFSACLYNFNTKLVASLPQPVNYNNDELWRGSNTGFNNHNAPNRNINTRQPNITSYTSHGLGQSYNIPTVSPTKAQTKKLLDKYTMPQPQSQTQQPQPTKQVEVTTTGVTFEQYTKSSPTEVDFENGFDDGYTVQHTDFDDGHTVKHSGFGDGHTVQHNGFDDGHTVQHSGFDDGHTVQHSGFDDGHTVQHNGFDDGYTVQHTSSSVDGGTTYNYETPYQWRESYTHVSPPIVVEAYPWRSEKERHKTMKQNNMLRSMLKSLHGIGTGMSVITTAAVRMFGPW